ncbi:MAG: hypothetical protein ACKVU0_16785 [Saprospiraceae bacterium]
MAKYALYLVLFAAYISISGGSNNVCTIPPLNNDLSGDNFYASSICNQEFVDFVWVQFEIHIGDWDGGLGVEAPCNVNLPFARALNTLYLMAYSSDDYARNMSDFSGNALRWAFPYCAIHAEELDAACGNGTAFATRFSDHGIFQNGRIELYLPFFYQMDVPSRAGTILHETHHKFKDHNGGTACPWGNTCDSDWNFQGTNMYETLYLWWFGVAGTRTTEAIRRLALNQARVWHNNRFVVNPGFSI